MASGCRWHSHVTCGLAINIPWPTITARLFALFIHSEEGSRVHICPHCGREIRICSMMHFLSETGVNHSSDLHRGDHHNSDLLLLAPDSIFNLFRVEFVLTQPIPRSITFCERIGNVMCPAARRAVIPRVDFPIQLCMEGSTENVVMPIAVPIVRIIESIRVYIFSLYWA